MTKTKKVGAAGRLRAGYGKSVRGRITEVEAKQRKKQTCPFCKCKALKRTSKGIWNCSKCGKRFASNAYYMD